MNAIVIDSRAAFPLPIEVLKDSALSVYIVRANPIRNVTSITSVAVSVTDASGTTNVYSATASGATWVVTIPATKFATAGTVTGGLLVSATGKDEANVSRTWKVALADLVVLDDDGEVVPGVVKHAMAWFDTQPTAPAKGDVCEIDGVLSVYNGSSWISLSGGSALTLDDTVTQSSSHGVKSSGIWTWVKGLLPSWLTSDYAEPATAASVAAKYTKPSAGIPATDMTEAVQDSLGKANEAAKVTDHIGAGTWLMETPYAAPTLSRDANNRVVVDTATVFSDGTFELQGTVKNGAISIDV